MNRIFMFANNNCYGNAGGGHGGEYLLYRANQKYHFIKNIFFIFLDRVIKDEEDCGALAVHKNASEKHTRYKKLKKYVPDEMAGLKRSLFIKNNIRNNRQYLSELNDRYKFTSDDIYIFHDLQMAMPFVKEFPYKNTMMVYHGQGSIYNEWVHMTGRQSFYLRKICNRFFSETVQKINYLAFPSKGAEESLVTMEPDLRQIVKQANIKYMYSGIDCPDLSYGKLSAEYKKIADDTGLKFATVATLNEAKAVERIPQYLGTLKKKGYDFKWFLVGSGVKEKEVRENIRENDIEDHVVWINNYISHDEILQLLYTTDFYILFHKCSIFDLSTLEAMHYGNIPILTPVGGNKEVILEDNGIFVGDFTDTRELEEMIHKGRVEELHEKNRQVQTKYYDDKSFLRRYADFCSSFAMEN